MVNLGGSDWRRMVGRGKQGGGVSGSRGLGRGEGGGKKRSGAIFFKGDFN